MPGMDAILLLCLTGYSEYAMYFDQHIWEDQGEITGNNAKKAPVKIEEII